MTSAGRSKSFARGARLPLARCRREGAPTSARDSDAANGCVRVLPTRRRRSVVSARLRASGCADADLTVPKDRCEFLQTICRSPARLRLYVVQFVAKSSGEKQGRFAFASRHSHVLHTGSSIPHWRRCARRHEHDQFQVIGDTGRTGTAISDDTVDVSSRSHFVRKVRIFAALSCATVCASWCARVPRSGAQLSRAKHDQTARSGRFSCSSAQYFGSSRRIGMVEHVSRSSTVAARRSRRRSSWRGDLGRDVRDRASVRAGRAWWRRCVPAGGADQTNLSNELVCATRLRSPAGRGRATAKSLRSRRF